MSKYLPFLLGTGRQPENAQYGMLELCNHGESKSKLLCVESVPAYMIPTELLHYFSFTTGKLTSCKIYRHYSNPMNYMALILVDCNESAVQIMNDFNGQLMSSLNGKTYCQISLVVEIEFIGSGADGFDNLSEMQSLLVDLGAEDSRLNNMMIFNQPSQRRISRERLEDGFESDLDQEAICPVCLEPFNSPPLSFTTSCKHKFHMTCITMLEGPQCPVCRFQHDTSLHSTCECFVCGWQGRNEFAADLSAFELSSSSSGSSSTGEGQDLWVCLICGFTGCGSEHNSHIQAHYCETLHAYAMNTENRRVWDFAGEGYVHRLILNGTSVDNPVSNSSNDSDSRFRGVNKMVEMSVQSEEYRDQRAPLSAEQEETIVNRKLESAAYHYNQLLAWQMQQNRLRYETSLQRIRDSVLSSQTSTTSSANKQGDWQHNMLLSLRTEHGRVVKQLEAAEERLVRAQKESGVHRELHRSLQSNQTEWQNRVQAANDKCQVAEQSLRRMVVPLEERVQELMEKLDSVHRSSTGERQPTVHSSDTSASEDLHS